MARDALQIRWHLDHDADHVLRNGEFVPKVTAQLRAPGPTAITAAECGYDTEGPAPLLHFVEAGDRGEALNPEQARALFRALDEARSAGMRAIVALFVHGWQHSAARGDSYVCSYARLIRAIGTMESDAAGHRRQARRVFGVYVGWPGKLYDDEVVNTVTFWNRLRAADRLGANDALLRQVIDGVTQRLIVDAGESRPDRRSALIVTGHSLGARAVFHAMGAGIAMPTGAASGASRPALVLLVNPAFSATLYRSIHQQERECRPIGVPLLSFSSAVDGVTRQVYPAGQSLTYERAANPPPPFPEHVYTAANFRDFVTHRLTMKVLNGPAPSPTDAQTIVRGFKRVPEGSGELIRDNPVTVFHQPTRGYPRPSDEWYRMELTPVDPSPKPCLDRRAQVIEVDAGILPDHGTIFTPPFLEYVVRALNRSILGR
jgi:hypothetical protein